MPVIFDFDGVIADTEKLHFAASRDVLTRLGVALDEAAYYAKYLGYSDQRMAEALDYVGVLAVEFFVAGEIIYVNEIAPRVHNSGHWTIDACPASQFEMHIRAVAGLPLPTPERHSDAVMKNLVGPEETALWPDIVATPGLIPHLYGKAEARPGRKMGHVTRLFPLGSLPGAFGIAAALGPLKAGDGSCHG